MNVTVSIDENIRKELDILSREYHVDLATLLKKLILRGLEFEKKENFHIDYGFEELEEDLEPLINV